MANPTRESAWNEIKECCSDWHHTYLNVEYPDLEEKMYKLREELVAKGVDQDLVIECIVRAYRNGFEAAMRRIYSVIVPVEWAEEAEAKGVPYYDGDIPPPKRREDLFSGVPAYYGRKVNTAFENDENPDDFESSDYDANYYRHRQERKDEYKEDT